MDIKRCEQWLWISDLRKLFSCMVLVWVGIGKDKHLREMQTSAYKTSTHTQVCWLSSCTKGPYVGWPLYQPWLLSAAETADCTLATTVQA